MILHGENLLQWSLLQIFCFDSFIDIIKGCLKHLKLSFLNCSEGRRSIKHDYIPSKGSLKAYLGFKYPTRGLNWLWRFLRNSLYCDRCIMTMCSAVL